MSIGSSSPALAFSISLRVRRGELTRRGGDFCRVLGGTSDALVVPSFVSPLSSFRAGLSFGWLLSP
ncbi:hypothetical protein M407DRAFT_143824 [Tulasnella calospora MUT 4182]|uniref:Uncharacterized protein n=1 Tax=Tulasnella calospora MUT 4182 TaxID=1051891 RepID=A0A0C3QSF1_9AGAM|nr:hypothetical protein M407DRAFT_143824 [Tulasnella calospora MUT 4182]